MSSVDERIVRMEFDNRQFESGVSTTLTTLEKLKDALKFREGTNGFDDIQKASDSLNFSPLDEQLFQVRQNFSFFGEFVETVFTRISNKIIDVGSLMVRELTTNPLRAGFGEYELQMGSTQTIMASTGKSIEEVTAYLDELNTYADKTIYSFSDMTQNIGKFTNAGVELDVAVKAIQGISNEAAVSGANAQEASRAMYNFSQALSAGYVKLIDWKSIENANMATKEFKQQLIDTAVEMGTLEQTTDGMYRVLGTNANGATMRDTISATKNFNDSLSYQWMTSDVLTATLAKYADETTEIGKKAFAAATEVKTFSQLIDTVKESLGSGWTKSFSYIFGNLEEAKVLWTGVNNEITSILDPIANAREEMLKFWHDNGGRATAIKAISDAWQGLKAIITAISDGFSQIFSPMTGQRLVDITKSIGTIAERFRNIFASSRMLLNVTKMVRGFASVLRLVVSIAGALLSSLQPLVQVVSDFSIYLIYALAEFGDFLTVLTDTQKRTSRVKEAFSELKGSLRYIVQGLDNLIESLLKLVKINFDQSPLTSFYDTITGFVSALFNFDALDSIGAGIEAAIGRIVDAFNTLFVGIKPPKISFESVGSFFSSIGETISEWVPNIIKYLGSQEFRDALSSVDLLAGGGLLVALTGLSTNISSLVDGAKEAEKAPGVFEQIAKFFSDMIQPFVELGKTVVDSFTSVVDQVRDHLDSFQHVVRPARLIVAAISIGILAASISELSKIETDKAADAIATLVVSMLILVGGLKLLTSALDITKIDKSIPKMMIGLALSLYIMGKAVEELASIGWDNLMDGLTGVGAIIIELASFLKIVNGTKISFGSLAAILVVAGAIRILDNTVGYLSSFSWDDMLRGLAGVGLLLGGLVAFVRGLNGMNVNFRGILAVIAVAAAIKILESTVSAFSSIGWDGLSTGLAGIGFLIFELAAFMLTLNGVKMSFSSIAAVATLALVLYTIGDVLTSISSISSEGIESSLITIATVLGALTLALVVLGEGSPLMLAGAVALVVVAKALEVLIPIVTSLADIDYMTLLKSLGALGAGLIGLSVGLAALGFVSPFVVAISLAIMVLGGAVAVVGAALGVFGTGLLAVTQALDALAASVKSLSDIAFADLLKSLGVLSVGMIGLAVGFAALGFVSPLIIAFSVSVIALGAAIGVAGLAIGVFGAGLLSVTGAITAFVASITAVSGALGLICSSIVTTFASIGEGIASGILAFVERIPEILSALGAARDALLIFLAESIPSIIAIVSSGIVSLLSVISTYIPQLASVVVQFIYAVVQVVVIWLPALAQILVTGAVTLLDSVANGIRDNSERILSAIRNILSSIIELVLTALADIVRLIPGVGDTIAGFIEDGRDAVRDSLAPESFEGMADDAMTSAVGGIERGGDDLSKVAGDVGIKAHDSLTEGLGDSTGIGDSMLAPIIQEFQAHTGDFTDIGSLNMDAFETSMVDSADGGTGDAVIASVLDGMGGHEQDFAGLAEMDTSAFEGVFNNGSAASSAGSYIDTAVNGLKSGTSKFSSTATTDISAFSNVLGRGNARASGAALASTGAAGAGSKKPAFISSGTDMTSGFSYGMASPYALSLARQAAAKVGKTALDSIRNTIRSASPSKETMKLGKYVTQGFAIGIGSLTRDVYTEGSDVGYQALDGIRDTLGEMSKYLDSDIDYNPVIRPVLDLSEIQNGVTQMNRLIGNGSQTPLSGIGSDIYAQRMIGMMGSSSISGLPVAQTTTTNEISYNITLSYEAAADANQMARDIMREVKRIQLTKGA